MRYDDYDAAGVWKDRWYYQYRPNFGLAEFRDDYPASGITAWCPGGVQKKVFSEPIGWGNVVVIGSVYQNNPTFDTLSSCPPTAFGRGKQVVWFQDYLPTFTLSNGQVYHDVLVFLYQQTFGGKTAGAVYYNAKNIGPVALKWAVPIDQSKQVTWKVDPTDATRMVMDPTGGQLFYSPLYEATVTSR
jgi:hypothetical protein